MVFLGRFKGEERLPWTKRLLLQFGKNSRVSSRRSSARTTRAEIKRLIRQAYDLVFAKLPRKTQVALGTKYIAT